MIHPIIKPTKKIDINFNIANTLNEIEIPEESKKITSDYLQSDSLLEDYDLMLTFEKAIIFGFDYVYEGKKIALIEMNPTTIFYSNAIMSFGMLIHYKEKLLKNSYEIGNMKDVAKPNHFGDFFNLAVNCIINLQASIESFLNYTIANNYIFLDKKQKPRKPTIHEKLEVGICKVTEKYFITEFKNDFELIKKLVDTRNNIIHLKPDEEETNTKFKVHYRKIIDFDFESTINAVEKFINFYEPNLIEKCSCGRQFMFDFIEKK